MKLRIENSISDIELYRNLSFFSNALLCISKMHYSDICQDSGLMFDPVFDPVGFIFPVILPKLFWLSVFPSFISFSPSLGRPHPASVHTKARPSPTGHSTPPGGTHNHMMSLLAACFKASCFGCLETTPLRDEEQGKNNFVS